MEDGQGMDGGMKGWVDGWMDGQMDGWVDGWVNRSVDGSVDGCPPRGRLPLPLPSSLPLLPSPPARPGRPAAPLPPRGRSAPRPAPPPHLTGGAGAAGPSRAIPTRPTRSVPSHPGHGTPAAAAGVGFGVGAGFGAGRQVPVPAGPAAQPPPRPPARVSGRCAPPGREGERGRGKKIIKHPQNFIFFFFWGSRLGFLRCPGASHPRGLFLLSPFFLSSRMLHAPVVVLDGSSSVCPREGVKKKNPQIFT